MLRYVVYTLVHLTLCEQCVVSQCIPVQHLWCTPAPLSPTHRAHSYCDLTVFSINVCVYTRTAQSHYNNSSVDDAQEIKLSKFGAALTSMDSNTITTVTNRVGNGPGLERNDLERLEVSVLQLVAVFNSLLLSVHKVMMRVCT
jgi:hypothetical protein